MTSRLQFAPQVFFDLEESHCKAVFSQYASRVGSQEVSVKVYVRVIDGNGQVIRHFSRKRQASSAYQIVNSVMLS